MNQPIRFTLPLRSRLMFLFLTLVIGMIITGTISYFIMRSGMTTPKVRIATVMQDLFLFILPAIATAVIITRRPAELLAIAPVRIVPLTWIAAIGALIASIPAMNTLVEWNASLSLPDSLASVEQWMRTSEESAQAMIEVLTGPHSVISLIISILIVGIFAGFSEEILFRGALQRILVTGHINVHAAVWFTAFIFSAIHLQFFGFFPRLLLGAFFGYLLVWTRSLWVPVTLHALNNTIVVISMWRSQAAATATQPIADSNSASSVSTLDLNTLGAGSPLWVSLSIILTALFLYLVIRSSRSTQ